MKKIILGVCLSLLAVATHATTTSVKQPVQSAHVLKPSNTYLKQQIQKKRLYEKEWNKQADDFIGLKRVTAPKQSHTAKEFKGLDHYVMLTAQNLEESLGSI